MALMIEALNAPTASPLRHRDGDSARVQVVPEHLRRFLAPAERIIYEWTPYVIEWEGATRLQIGSLWLNPISHGVFSFSIDNQLGLTSIRAFDDRGPLGDPIRVEVIARKFTSPELSVAFLRQTLADLFARLAASPFVLSAATERHVNESQAPPNELFAFHFFRHHGRDLIRASQAIQGRPHQRLSSNPELVRPHKVRQIDRESMVRMLRAGHPSPVETEGIDRLTPLQRLRPERVWQHLSFETFDTPENRFVLAVSRRMLGAAQAMQRKAWYSNATVDALSRRLIDETAEHLAMLTMDDRFAPLGPMVVTPTQSRVLQRRDGYRELAVLWQRFQRSRQPMFEQMQQAIDLRNIADLYEFWVWFELIDIAREITGTEPTYLPVLDAFGAPGWMSSAQCDGYGTLSYNRTFRGYSNIWLRPDYVWERPDGSLIVIDAKFRMQKPTEILEEMSVERGYLTDQRAKADDLQKMHAYRDAIRGVRAAVVLYPGHVAAFRATDGARLHVDLGTLLTGDVEGVGAIPMSPVAKTPSEE